MILNLPKVSPKAFRYMELQLAFHQVTKDGLKLHENLPVRVFAITVRGRRRQGLLLTGLQQLQWQNIIKTKVTVAHWV